eukprot:TRINITY_DN43_c0_g1_i1.p1 TRINITY_DN43_c0_g1~~TRINITY_DN43_c0_g1_i1.p1  ORF type:complete len:151 (-),score=41.99 TRINITY_DN43_c0_g1_i1:256-708(-)
MAMSGVKLTDACMTTYNDIQKSKKYRYAIFLIRNEREIDVEKVGERDSQYSDYVADLQQKDGTADDCRYGLYDYDYKYSPDGAESINRSKIFLMSWCPDTSKVKKKMLYSASFETIQKSFVGVHKAIQANFESDLEQQAVEEILTANDRR